MESSSHPLQVMISELGPPQSADDPSTIASEHHRPEAPSHIKLSDQTCTAPASIHLSGLKHPAVLINFDMEIAWQNKSAVEHIWQNAGTANNGSPTPNIFDVIFDASFKRKVANFSRCLTFFMDQMLGFLSREDMERHFTRMTEERQTTMLSFLKQLPEQGTRSAVYGGYFHQQLRNGNKVSYLVVAFNCEEGRLLVFEPQMEDPLSATLPVKQVTDSFERIRRQPNPIETSHFLIAAQINQSSRLKTEMLAQDHWRLVSTLYRRCLTLVESHGGIFGRHMNDGFLVYFLPDQECEVDAFRVIECALDIKAEAVELNRQWKISKNWPCDLDLNIGIHYEQAYLGTLQGSSGEIISDFGEGMGVVNAISQKARDGQIWATKPVINRMGTEKSKKLRFGIIRPGRQEQQAFVRHGFAAIRDVFDTVKSGDGIDAALTYLPITQIFDLSGGDG